MADSPYVSYATEGAVARLRLDRPEKLNAITTGMRGAIRDAVAAFEGDDDWSVLVVSGAGDAFCAGTDVSELEGRTADSLREAIGAETGEGLRIRDLDLPGAIEAVRKPTVAMVDGIALGGGLELALACDVRIASSDAEFGFPEADLVGLPGEGGTQRLPREVGEGLALYMILSGRRLGAERAREAGLVQAVHPPGEIATETTALAEEIAGKDRAALVLAKRAVTAADGTSFEEGAALEGLFGDLLETLPEREERLREF